MDVVVVVIVVVVVVVVVVVLLPLREVRFYCLHWPLNASTKKFQLNVFCCD